MVNNDASVYSAMQTGRPLKTFTKTILGQVLVKYLNPFSEAQDELILKGQKGSDGALIDVWSQREEVFFRAMNRKHLSEGTIIEFERPEVSRMSEEERMNTLPDEELNKVLHSKFLSFQSGLNKMTSEAVVYRLLMMAREQDVSEKYIEHITARLAEIQGIPE